jgi:hypothetical protein
VHLVGFITKNFFTMHGHRNVKKSVNWSVVEHNGIRCNIKHTFWLHSDINQTFAERIFLSRFVSRLINHIFCIRLKIT